MENLRFNTLNGRVKGDVPGKFTFINSNGKSTIDQAWAILKAFENIYSFSADHVLLNSFNSLCTIKLGSRSNIIADIRSQQSKISYVSKLKFKSNNQQAYEYNLNHIDNIYYIYGNVDKLAENLEIVFNEVDCKTGMLNIQKINHKNWKIIR